MSSSAGKGDKKRPLSIAYSDWVRNYERVFKKRIRGTKANYIVIDSLEDLSSKKDKK